jgi:hypothetical protein
MDLPIRATHYLQSECIAASVNTGSSVSYWMELKATNNISYPNHSLQQHPKVSLNSLPATALMVQEAQRELQKLHDI